MGATVQLDRVAARRRWDFQIDERVHSAARAAAEAAGISPQVWIESLVTWAVQNNYRAFPAVVVTVDGEDPIGDVLPFRSPESWGAAGGVHADNRATV